MPDPPTRQGALDIPPQLYEDLTLWHHIDCMDKSSQSYQAFKGILATENFDEVHFEDTQDRMNGVFHAFNEYRNDKRINDARRAIRHASIVVKAEPPKEEPQASESDACGTQNGVCDDFTNSLAATLLRISGVHTLTLNLENLTEAQDQDLKLRMSIAKVAWRQLHTLKIRGSDSTVKMIMSHCDPDVLSALHFYSWIDSEPMRKAKLLKKIDRLHLYYDKDDISDAGTWPCIDEETWKKLVRRWRRFHLEGRLEWLILCEPDVQIDQQLDNGHLSKLRSAIDHTMQGVRTLQLKRFAFTLNYQRFQPAFIREFMGKEPRPNALKDREINSWYSQTIKVIMTAPTLSEVWAFSNKSLAFRGTRNSDGEVIVVRVTVEHPTLNTDFQGTTFPWGLVDEQ